MNPTKEARGFSSHTAAAITVGLLLVTFVLVAGLTDRPLLHGLDTARRAERAAMAVRDLVPAFQQWGSRAFTMPNLEAGYGQVAYLTVSNADVDWKMAFQQRLIGLLRAYAAVDVFLLAHSNSFVDWAREVDPTLRRRLRLVYNTGCFDLKQKQAWLELGARGYVGHVGLSESPIFYVYFLRRWLRGEPLDELVPECNLLTERMLQITSGALQFNPLATAASTHAEYLGDGALAIGSIGR
ncbi:MAG TPA: hypothetical protein VFZ65_18285 [Planctomycetota bacterium]|nr:hypothetical protein [Planctomycetota bacterium]